MSRNYDNWERLVAAVLKREQIWQLCHQDSISSSIFSDDSSDLGLSLRFSDLPFSLGNFDINRTFRWGLQVGKGDFGATNIALLRQDVRVSDQKCFAKGSKAAIKSLKTVKVNEDEFKQWMIVFGNCRHENVGQPQAYYYSDKTKLIVYDHYARGSVSDILHGRDRRSRPDWKSRLRIAIGAARGLAHIHRQLGGSVAHGNIKSSNIFLNSRRYGCVSDFGLAAISQQWGFGSPWKHIWKPYELIQYSQSQMSDVYSFGLLLLELVTGESPSEKAKYYDRNLLVDELDMHDDMGRFPEDVRLDNDILYAKQEAEKMLQVAERCLARFTNRATISDVVWMLENIYINAEVGEEHPWRPSPNETQIVKWSEKCPPTLRLRT